MNKFIKKFFSITNQDCHKIITIFGIKFKFKSNKLIEQKKWEDLNSRIATILDLNSRIATILMFSHETVDKLNAINRNVNTIFQYISGIELNNNFVMEREILFSPERAPIDHYNRYSFAVENISENDTVADIACTCGYGSFMLGKKAYKVIGVDIDEAVINFANKVFKKDNIEFYCQDAQSLTLKDGLDVVVSFETIEHIPHPELFLQKINSLLKANGKIICSVPNETTMPFAKSSNRFHFRHYTKDELIELLTRCGFSVEDIYEQYKEDNYKIEKKDYEGQMIIAVARK